MRSLRYLPFAFLAGQHGFALFAPYLMLFALMVPILRRRRAVAVPVRA